MRHTFARKVASVFRELSERTEHVETKPGLLKSVIITYIASSCACKYVGDHTGREKRTAWLKQEVNVFLKHQKGILNCWKNSFVSS